MSCDITQAVEHCMSHRRSSSPIFTQLMEFYPAAVSGTDGDDDDYDFEKSFTSSFCTDDQFEAAFHRSDHLFSRACSVVEEADGWGVSDWQAAASWTVTAMVDTLNWEGSDVDRQRAPLPPPLSSASTSTSLLHLYFRLSPPPPPPPTAPQLVDCCMSFSRFRGLVVVVSSLWPRRCCHCDRRRRLRCRQHRLSCPCRHQSLSPSLYPLSLSPPPLSSTSTSFLLQSPPPPPLTSTSTADSPPFS